MGLAYRIVTIVLAVTVLGSGIAKIRHDPHVVRVVHDVVGVPLKYLPLLAACEFAGALGVVLGFLWPPLGIAAGVGLVLYFIGVVVSHLRLGDAKGTVPAVFLLAVASAALILRVLT
jgi:hypothetical protein